MTAGRKIERRRVQHRPLVLEHSFLFRVSPRYAWTMVLSALFAVSLVERLVPREIWFGPVYLAVVCLAAWSLSTRTAVVLGISVLAVKLATGNLAYYPMGTVPVLANMVVRIIGIAIVVSFISLARKSCEREWHLARTDLLTGALNRQAFFELVRSGLCSGGYAALIYADLDGLKQLNDQYGHDRGDECLKNFAGTVRQTIRKGDVLARMGGDEFVIFMKLRDEVAGQAVARRLHKALNAGEGQDSSDLTCSHLTCSLGVLVLPEGAHAIDAELRAADELMYRAKQSRSGFTVATGLATDGGIALTISEPVLPHESEVRQSDRPAGRRVNLPEPPRAAA
ncbi:GGDEF domain-containing protein [Novosphingobium album (ex Hu et al. 2023)]|uniref:diguanylate cyclase n=1 Tax=Novosphingobium album (ex Hu et al. 2023) TaxID=2930093 RepID=A0ABT0AYL0_9SPHN|nr:GGDEF domain-containing protein [Novosphingobium album (ex Hu et al. 2023)]MCJ2177629.1 GGDEF domain-containing protein [Novosphingobium album (ex Hu et al. 2023)]